MASILLISFNTIKNFINLIECCPFCNQELDIFILNKNNYSLMNNYSSNFDGKYLYYNFTLNNITKCILTIDIKTNKVMEDPELTQCFIWDLKPIIVRGCKKCPKSTYINESSILYLERKNNKIYQFNLDKEIITIPFNDNIYGLMSMYKDNVTYLTSTISVLQELPLINLWKMTDSETITSKIKTMILFS